MLKLIVATNNLGVIGKDGNIPWKCKADMKHFKELTTGHFIIMGSSTWKSMGSKPLPNRVSVIISKTMELPEGDCVIVESIMELAEFIILVGSKLHKGDFWIIGGEQIYQQCIHLCDEVHWSHINDDSPGDAKFELPTFYKGKVFHYNFEVNEGTGRKATLT